MTQEDLFAEVNTELTVGGSLPYSLPEAEMKRILKQTLQFFYQNYTPSAQKHFYILSKDKFNKTFRTDRTIQLPDCVLSVYQVQEITGWRFLGSVDKDFAANKLIASELYLSPFQSDDLVLRIAQWSYFDLTKALFNAEIQFDYSFTNQELKLIGHDPLTDIIIRTYIKIDENKLMEDYYFIRYFTCQCKISLSRMLGVTTYSLPGGITLNADYFKSEAEQELDSVKESIKSYTKPNFMMFFNG